jgi:hypothetical protein
VEACLRRRPDVTREVPTVRACAPQLAARESWSRAVRDGGEVRSTDEAANHRRGKGPWLKDNVTSDKEQESGDEPNTSHERSEIAEETSE